MTRVRIILYSFILFGALLKSDSIDLVDNYRFPASAEAGDEDPLEGLGNSSVPDSIYGPLFGEYNYETRVGEEWIGTAMDIIGADNKDVFDRLKETAENMKCPFMDKSFGSIRENMRELIARMLEVQAQSDQCKESLGASSAVVQSGYAIDRGWGDLIQENTQNLPTDGTPPPATTSTTPAQDSLVFTQNMYTFMGTLFNDPKCFQEVDANTIVKLSANAMRLTSIIPNPATWGIGLAGDFIDRLQNFINSMIFYYGEPARTERRIMKQELALSTSCLLMSEGKKITDLAKAINENPENVEAEMKQVEQEIRSHEQFGCFLTHNKLRAIGDIEDEIEALKVKLKSPNSSFSEKCTEVSDVVNKLKDNKVFFDILENHYEKLVIADTDPSNTEYTELGRIRFFFDEIMHYDFGEDCEMLKNGEIVPIEEKAELIENILGNLNPVIDIARKVSRKKILELESNPSFGALMKQIEILKDLRTQQRILNHIHKNGTRAHYYEIEKLYLRYEAMRRTLMNPIGKLSYRRYLKTERKLIKKRFKRINKSLRQLKMKKQDKKGYCDIYKSASAELKLATTGLDNMLHYCEEMKKANDSLSEGLENLADVMNEKRVLDSVLVYSSDQNKKFFKECDPKAYYDMTNKKRNTTYWATVKRREDIRNLEKELLEVAGKKCGKK